MTQERLTLRKIRESSYPLLPSAPSFSLAPRHQHVLTVELGFCLVALFFHAQSVILLTFGPHYSWFSRLSCLFLLFQVVPDPLPAQPSVYF